MEVSLGVHALTGKILTALLISLKGDFLETVFQL